MCRSLNHCVRNSVTRMVAQCLDQRLRRRQSTATVKRGNKLMTHSRAKRSCQNVNAHNTMPKIIMNYQKKDIKDNVMIMLKSKRLTMGDLSGLPFSC